MGIGNSWGMVNLYHNCQLQQNMKADLPYLYWIDDAASDRALVDALKELDAS